MNVEELDELIRVVRQDAGLIKVLVSGEWIDLRPVLVDQMKEHKETLVALEKSRLEVLDLQERLERVANRDW